jgi:hypothetical protein
MSDERTEQELRAWFEAQTNAEVPASLRRFLADLPDDGPMLRQVRPRDADRRVDRRLAALRLLVASAVIALIGVGLSFGLDQGPWHLAGVSPRPSASESSPAGSPPAPNETSTGVLDAAPIDAQRGWALTGHDVLWTDDGGRTWRSIWQPASPDATVRAVHFLDPMIGWVASWTPEAGQVALQRTSDGGKHWIVTLLPDVYPDGVGRVSIEAVDADTMWVQVEAVHGSAFSIGGLYASHDGGATWVPEVTIPGGWPVRFVSPADGWTFSGPLGDHLQATNDGGKTWHETIVGLPPGHEDDAKSFDLPTFTSASGLGATGVLPVTLYSPPVANTSDVTATLALYTTDDHGRSWRLAGLIGRTTSLGQGVTIPSMIFDQRVWTVASDPGSGTLSFTKDSGATWSDIGATGLADVGKLRFVDGAHGWALKQSNGADYRLSATENGGETWRQLAPVAAVAPPPASSAAADPYRWTPVDGGADLATYAIAQAIRRGDGTYLAIGSGGTGEVRILRSPDGRTWTVEPGDPGLLAASADHLSIVNGIADGASGLVAVGAMALDDISSGDARAWTSTDGVTWHVADVSGATDTAVEAVVAGPNGYVAVGSDGFPGGNVQLPGARGAAVWSSPDGAHWSRVPDEPSFHDAIMLGVRRSGTGYVAWGQTLVGVVGPPPPPVWSSADGLHWVRSIGGIDTGGPGSPVASIVSAGGKLVAVGTHQITTDQGPAANVPGTWTSDDRGRTWTVSPVADDIASSGGSGGLFDVDTVGTDLVAVGYVDAQDGTASAAAWRSTDQGTTWARLADGRGFAGANLRHIVSTGTGFLVFGQSDDPNGGPTTNLVWVVEPATP